MQQLFQGSMAIVRYLAQPTFFPKFTANPRWPEIVREFLYEQQPTDRPDIVAHVFRWLFRTLAYHTCTHSYIISTFDTGMSQRGRIC